MLTMLQKPDATMIAGSRAWQAATPVTAVEQCVAHGTPTYLLRLALERGHRQGYLTAADRDRLEVALEARDGA